LYVIKSLYASINLLSPTYEFNDIDKEDDIYVHCAGGYRSVIAISILKQKGFENLIDVAGGFGAIKKSNLNESCYSSFAQCAG